MVGSWRKRWATRGRMRRNDCCTRRSGMREAVRDALQRFVIEEFGDGEGIGVVDDTGFLKKGVKSAGVQRQYSGTAGKVENCQLGVFLTYATAWGHTFLDRRLLPEEWCADRERCKEAKVPADVGFATKGELAVAMLRHAWRLGVPMHWVTADEVYGESRALRNAVAESGRWYVFAVGVHNSVWLARPEVGVPAWQGRGRKPFKARVLDASARLVRIPALVASWPDSRWQRSAGRGRRKGRSHLRLGLPADRGKSKTRCRDGTAGSWCDVR